MKYFPVIIVLLGICFICLTSCHRDMQQQQVSEDSLKEQMINANKIMVQNESDEIDEFISRHQWKMTMSGTGLRYEIYAHAGSKPAKKPGVRSEVSIAYSLYLEDGTLCYSAGEKNPLTFVIGRGEQTHGLEEGLMLMSEGDKARFVLPAHLGYGMLGDGIRIPRKSILYYDVTLLNVNELK